MLSSLSLHTPCFINCISIILWYLPDMDIFLVYDEFHSFSFPYSLMSLVFSTYKYFFRLVVAMLPYCLAFSTFVACSLLCMLLLWLDVIVYVIETLSIQCHQMAFISMVIVPAYEWYVRYHHYGLPINQTK